MRFGKQKQQASLLTPTQGLCLTYRRVATVIRDISVLLGVVASILQQSDTFKNPHSQGRRKLSPSPDEWAEPHEI